MALGSAAAWWCFRQGSTLFYGDAEAHLAIARRIVDSRTPGVEQFGTAWLPLPHALMLPFVHNSFLWTTGLAGAIPGVICFSLAGLALFRITLLALDSKAAAGASVFVFSLNPNLLYLQSTPMTEAVLLAAFLGSVFFALQFARTQRYGSAVAAGLCTAAATLTRYEGWVLIPLIALCILTTPSDRRWRAAFTFGLIASAGPVSWLLYNLYFYSNPLEFYNGPYSTMAYFLRGHEAGPPYPAAGNWLNAMKYYAAAAYLCIGTPAICLGLAGAGVALFRRRWWPVILLAAVPVFYTVSLHGSGTEIYVPILWPYSYYNTRYGIGSLPLLAFGCGAIISAAPDTFRAKAGLVLACLTAMPWLPHPEPSNCVTWAESRNNSEDRRAWTAAASDYLQSEYRQGAGIFFLLGDLTGVLREARIPMKESLHDGNGPAALAAEIRPDLFLHEEWVLAISGDPVSNAMMDAVRSGLPYQLVRTVQTGTAPAIEIYRRSYGDPIHKSPRRLE